MTYWGKAIKEDGGGDYRGKEVGGRGK